MKIAVTPARLCLLFVVLILLTRSTHLAFTTPLPDATIALMLLGGMWIRRWPGFAALMAAVVAADWIATGTLGVPDYCLTPAYLGLVPAYLAVWFAGWWLHTSGRDASLAAWLATTLAASAAAFVVSNAFWYGFSGNFESWPLTRFIADVVFYYPAYAGPALAYVTLAWLTRLAARMLVRDRPLERAV